MLNVSDTLSREFRTGLSAYYIFLTTASLLFNIFLILTIVSKRKLQTVTNIFIINMAIGDLITTLFILPFDIDLFFRGWFPHGKLVCGFRESAFMLSLPSSITCLLLLTAERFISIVFPFRRIQFLRKRNAIIAILLAWSYNIILALVPIMISKHAIFVMNGACWLQYPPEYIYFQLSFNFLVPVVIIVILNFVLFRVASKHATEIKRRSLIGSGRKVRPSMITLGANIKAAKTILLLVVIFLICWLTFIILGIHNTMCHVCHPRFVTFLGNAINYSSVALNPILYGLRNSEIRKEFFTNSKKYLHNYCQCYTKGNQQFENSNNHTNHDCSLKFLDAAPKRVKFNERCVPLKESYT